MDENIFRLAPARAHGLSIAKRTGSKKGHDDHRTVPEYSGHCLGSEKMTGRPKRSLLPYQRRLRDLNTNILLYSIWFAPPGRS